MTRRLEGCIKRVNKKKICKDGLCESLSICKSIIRKHEKNKKI